MLYSKDLIAERDDYRRLHSSVVKWWNDSEYINAMNKQYEEYQQQQEMLSATNESAEAQANEIDESDYNATTGSYSGSYGKNANLNADELDQVSNILAARDDSLQNIINSNK